MSLLKRLTVANILFELLMDQWREEEWTVTWHLQPHKKEPNTLAHPDYETHTIHLYPHPHSTPPEMTGLHELIHVRLDLSGEKRDEDYTYFLESWLWQRLSKKQKETLHNIFVKPLQGHNGTS